MPAKYCYQVFANSPNGPVVTYPVGDSFGEAETKAYNVLPRGSRITKIINEETNEEYNP